MDKADLRECGLSVGHAAMIRRKLDQRLLPSRSGSPPVANAEDEVGLSNNDVDKSASDCYWDDELPIFVLDPLLTSQHMRLNIFEPRYRLMVQRCLEPSSRPRFGMVGRERGEHGGSLRYGAVAEIARADRLPDGRFALEVVGRDLFRIEEHWESDGYMVARVVWVYPDHSPGAGEQGNARSDDPSILNPLRALVEEWQKLVC